MNQPLTRFPITLTGDTRKAQSTLSREFLDVRVKHVANAGSFHMAMNGVHLGQTMVGYNHFAAETVVDAGEVSDSIFLVLGMGSPAKIQLDKEAVFSTEKFAVLSPSRQVLFELPSGSATLTVRARFSAIEKHFQETMARSLRKPIVFDRSVVLENGMGAKARRLLGSVIWNIEQDSTILDSPVLRAGLDEMLLNIITALPNNYSDDLAGNYQRSVAPVVVRMVEEFIEAHATEPISVSDLVALCKCSRAKLFNSFRHFRGYTPMQFLAECRLKSAHEALRFPTPSDTIASIAHACGFSHLGRFSVAYRRRYSENPSATLQKNGSSGMSRVKPK